MTNLALAYLAYVWICRSGSRNHRDLLHSSQQWPISVQHPCVGVFVSHPPEYKGNNCVHFDTCYILCDEVVPGIKETLKYLGEEKEGGKVAALSSYM